jgi:Ser/Thr protein kinase RdoA (MazF antagonist)
MAWAEIHPYSRLSPDRVIAAVEALGFACDGRVLALNSYENRVYQVGLDDAEPVVVKFYRPGRWSTRALNEEHAFAAELAAAEVPVVAPLVVHGVTLHRRDGFAYAAYARKGGRWPELATRDERVMMGRFIGRMHAVGAVRRFAHRAALDSRRLGREAADFLLDRRWLPEHLIEAYSTLIDDLLEIVDDRLREMTSVRPLRLHGDLHPGNVLWTERGPHIVDLDDAMSGPAVQDLWMLLSGTRDEMNGQLGDLLDGYREFADFSLRELNCIEALRTLRMIHYAAWLARRWDDPAFPAAFPWFAETRYWERHVLDLREQLAALGEEPLSPEPTARASGAKHRC